MPFDHRDIDVYDVKDVGEYYIGVGGNTSVDAWLVEIRLKKGE